MTPQELEILQVLDRLVHAPAVHDKLLAIGAALEDGLAKERTAALVWDPVDLSLYGGEVPPGIRSSWVFVLRANSVSGAERHPNSIQRVMSLKGSADLQTRPGDEWISHHLSSSPSAPIEDRWLSIPANVWHQGVMGDENWVVVSFHTVPPEELIEERPKAGGDTARRRYLA